MLRPRAAVSAALARSRHAGRGASAPASPEAICGQHRLRQRQQVALRHRLMVVRLRVGQGWRRCDRKQARQPSRSGRRAAGFDPAPGRADLLRPGIEEITVERHDGVGLREIPLRLKRLPECLHGAGIHRGATCGRVDVPVHLRHRALHAPDFGDQAGRGHRSGQQPKPLTAGGLQGAEPTDHGGSERVPVAWVRQMGHRGRTIGIVQTKHRGLCKDVGAATAPGMIRVAFDLDRAAVDGRDQHAVGDPVQHCCRGV